jgi:hypothetical protein
MEQNIEKIIIDYINNSEDFSDLIKLKNSLYTIITTDLYNKAEELSNKEFKVLMQEVTPGYFRIEKKNSTVLIEMNDENIKNIRCLGDIINIPVNKAFTYSEDRFTYEEKNHVLYAIGSTIIPITESEFIEKMEEITKLWKK